MEDGREGSTECRYTLPGVLHFLQHDWSRFELERVQWDAERAELTAKIAFLQGERRGQENIKRDLIRRIKMLEFALKKERIKVQKLKGLEPGPEPTPPDADDKQTEEQNDDKDDGENNGVQVAQPDSDLWAGGRQMLRQYLQEVGFTDTILDARSARLRALLGGAGGENDDDDEFGQLPGGPQKDYLPESGAGVAIVDDMPLDDKEAIDEFNFLSEESDWKPNREKLESMKNQLVQDRRRKRPPRHANDMNGDTTDMNKIKLEKGDNEPKSQNEMMCDLGELAELDTVNDADPLNLLTDASNSRRSWNHKYTLRSHLDGVRSVKFHPTEPLVLSGSEDQLVKVWNLSKPMSGKKMAQLDVEPVMNYRGHVGPVLTVEWGQNECFSGGLDGAIFAWPIPNQNTELYDPYDEKILGRRFEGHSDAVWSLAIHGDQLVSCAADDTVKLWSIEGAVCKQTYENEAHGTPNDVAFLNKEPNKVLITWTHQILTIVDIETGTEVMKFDNCVNVNSLSIHPTLPIAVTAHDDRNIRFWDLQSGLLVHSMVAHLEAVTSVTIDPSGLYLLSASHDASIRLWGFESKTCVQEFTAHRPKYNEAVHQASFHPNKGYVASAGADGLIKVFV